jgi:hypothetical protein
LRPRAVFGQKRLKLVHDRSPVERGGDRGLTGASRLPW